MNIPNPPQSNQPVSADWGRAIVECLRRLRPSNGPGISVNQTPEGTTYSLAQNNQRSSTALSQPSAAPALITGGSSAAGYTIDIYENGFAAGKTGTGTLYLPEVACDNSLDLAVGTPVLAHAVNVTITGGS